MGKWGKPTCRVCGLTLEQHPDQPCKRGISPQYLTEKARQETLAEKAAKRAARLRELNSAKRRRQARLSTKSCSGHKLPKQGRNTLTKTGKKSQEKKRAQNRAQPAKTRKMAVYNWRRF